MERDAFMSKKILVVDDDRNVVRMIIIRLEANGYEVFQAYGGKDALAKAGEVNPDLIILDVMMPSISGNQVCRQIKDNPELQKIKVVLLTAKTTDNDKFWGMESGADEYLSKPYKDIELLGKIDTLLNR